MSGWKILKRIRRRTEDQDWKKKRPNFKWYLNVDSFKSRPEEKWVDVPDFRPRETVVVWLGPTGTSEGGIHPVHKNLKIVNSAQDSYWGILCKLTGGYLSTLLRLYCLFGTSTAPPRPLLVLGQHLKLDRWILGSCLSWHPVQGRPAKKTLSVGSWTLTHQW